jgi:GNAT superfamily N-acetyltransferase
VTAADWDLLAAFHEQCSAQNMVRRWGRTRLMPRDLTRLLERSQCWIGLDADEQPLALVCIGPVSRELGLQGAAARRRQGIGTVLARHAARLARTHGARTLSAFTQAPNTPMLRLLDRLGSTRHTRDGPHVEVRVALDALAPDTLPSPETPPP